MNSRREFLKKSSLAGALLWAAPKLAVAGGSGNNRASLLRNLGTMKAKLGTADSLGNMTFNRSSFATYFDASGMLRFADQNALNYSTLLTFANWKPAGATVTKSTTVAAPDGSAATYVLTETNGAGEHRLSRGLDVQQGIIQTISVYLKAGTTNRAALSFANSSSFTTNRAPRVSVNLATGELFGKSTNILSSTIKDAGQGWWRVSITAIPDLGTSTGLHVYIMDAAGNISYPGSASRFIYVYGPQFEAGPAPSNYRPTGAQPYNGPRYNYNPATQELKGLWVEAAATNVLKQTANLSDSSIWLARNTIVQSDKITSPDGITKAIKLLEDTNAITHYLRPVVKPTLTVGQDYTFSAFVKAAERKWAYFMVEDATVHFDLVNGVVGSGTTNASFYKVNIQNIGDGWFRVGATFKATANAMNTAVGLEISNGAKSYKGDGASGIYVHAPQLEAGAFATSYVPSGPLGLTRNSESCKLIAPDDASTHDVFIQRTNGGSWISNVAGDYAVPASPFEIKTGSFWDANTSNEDKEFVAETLYKPTYVSPGFSTARLNIFGNDYRMQSANQGHSILVADNKSCQMYRFQVNSGDQWSSDAGKDKERAELYSLDKMPFNQDVWLSYAVRVAEGAPVTSGFCHLGQFHATEDPTETASVPVLTFRFSGTDDVALTTCSNADAITKKNAASITRYSGKMPRGKWIKHVMRIRFSHTDGQLQWWENGVEKVNITKAAIGNNDQVGPYWKYGIYRTRSQETLIAEYANMELSLDSLASRISNPLLVV